MLWRFDINFEHMKVIKFKWRAEGSMQSIFLVLIGSLCNELTCNEIKIENFAFYFAGRKVNENFINLCCKYEKCVDDKLKIIMKIDSLY